MRQLETHGLSRSPEYRVWLQLRQRCSNPKCPYFKNYGARGITVCERWHSFSNFIDDMGRRPSPRHQLDRINNDGPYAPDNCRWTTIDVQLRNRRVNNLLTHAGKTLTITDWASIVGLSDQAIRSRLQRGWSVDKALTTPPNEGSRKRSKHRTITFRGETRTLAEWNRRLGGSATTLLCRLKAGWSVERALTTPVAHSSHR